MFGDFLTLLRKSGLKVSTTEWMALQEGLTKNLHGATLTGFYHLCRSVLVKSEGDFDKFDRCFLQYFKGVPFDQEISQELLDWLDRPDMEPPQFDEEQALRNLGLSEEEIEQMLKERLQEQKEEHNGGKYWVGTHGMSVFGNGGLSPKGIRVGGESQHKSAFRVAGERHYADFRGDNTLDTRQFQVALRHLRQYSGLTNLPETEFDVDRTIKDTCDSGGTLKIRYRRPRHNTVKVLLLIDSGGSMDYYAALCAALFQAVAETRHFKDVQVYYFHNAPYGQLYTDPTLGDSHPTQWVLDNCAGEYKLIFVGDAQMAPHELASPVHYRTPTGGVQQRSGMAWITALKGKFPHAIWLNPAPRPAWGDYWTRTYDAIAREIPMFPLTVEGIQEGMKKLLVR